MRGDGWRAGSTSSRFRQGYLAADDVKSVRVRIEDDVAFITIKSASPGMVRAEFQYGIPAADAMILLDRFCQRPLIEKIRHFVTHADREWSVDEFFGDNAGLLIAEVELPHPDAPLVLPDWVGEEVTDDRRYYNANLSSCPYNVWRGGAR